MQNKLSNEIEGTDTLENRVQNQFNEEKWTRISARDITNSRFKILDSLIDEAKKENKLDIIKDLAKSHLDDYEPSIASRYIMGILLVEKNPTDDLLYLRQLLNQFQEISKWGVVDYLSEKILILSENSTILKARATALEKLGKSKEAIPVFEKLARIDRRDPDTALKYADAIIDTDIDKALQFYKLAGEIFAKNMQFDKIKSVLTKIIELTPDDFIYFRKIEWILSGYRQKETLVDIYVQLAHEFIRKEDTNIIIDLCKKILQYNPNYTRFKNELIKAYREKYKDNSLLEDFLKYSGLTTNKGSISFNISNFETNIVFDKGNYVFHRSWGVGNIKEINTKEMIIDFKEKKSHRMNIHMALKSLKPLKKDHFWVHRFEKPDDLMKLFEENICEFFKLLISSFDNRITLSDIKLELIDHFVPAKNWSKWWSKTRVEILKDDLIGVSPKKRDVIELSDNPITSAERLSEKFQNASSVEERIGTALEALKDSQENMDAIYLMIPILTENLKSHILNERIQVLWTLDIIADSLQENRFYDTKVEKELIEDFLKLKMKEIKELSSSIKSIDIKRKFLYWIKSHHSNWKEYYQNLLFETPIKIHKTILNELYEAGAIDEINNFIDTIRKNSKKHSEILIWFVKNHIQKAWDFSEDQTEDLLLSFFRLLKNLHKIETKGTKLKNIAKDMLIGSIRDDLIKSISNYAKGSVRKISILLLDIPFFTDSEINLFQEDLKQISPEAFSEEDTFSSESTMETFIASIEKDGKNIASKNAVEKLQKHFDNIVTIEIPANSEEIGIAQEKGDLRENSEYKAALEKQSMLQAEVKSLEAQLKSVAFLSIETIPLDYITVGTRVKLKDKKTGDIFSYSMMDKFDADVDKGIISYKSPLGQALIGCRIGELAKFGVGEAEQEFEIINIDKAIRSDGYLR